MTCSICERGLSATALITSSLLGWCSVGLQGRNQGLQPARDPSGPRYLDAPASWAVAAHRLVLCLLLQAGCLTACGKGLEFASERVLVRVGPDVPEVRVDFQAVNRSEHELEIDRIETSCGCTAATWTPSLVEPGGNLKVTGALTVGDRTGLQMNRLRVFLKHASAAPVELRMDVDIEPWIAVQPRVLLVAKDTTAEAKITLAEGYRPDLVELREAPQGWKVSLEPDSEDAAAYLLRAEPSEEAGQASVFVVASTQGKDQREVKVHLIQREPRRK